MPIIIDAHQHFWDPARAEYPWMTDELAAIRKAFGPEDLRLLLAARGVGGSILVQTRSSLEETREFLQVAFDTDFLAGVVGWVDLTDPAVGDTIAELRSAPTGRLLVGIRHQVHDEADPMWLLQRDVRRGLQAVDEAGLTYDLLVRSRELPAAVATARALPGLRLVIDHLGKPPIRTGALQPWAERIADFRGLSNVSCKLSGMVTEADWTAWRPDDLAPYVAHVLEVFGPEHLMFGSDWPVCLLAASYPQVFDATRDTLGGLTETELAGVFGENAAQVYRLSI